MSVLSSYISSNFGVLIQLIQINKELTHIQVHTSISKFITIIDKYKDITKKGKASKGCFSLRLDSSRCGSIVDYFILLSAQAVRIVVAATTRALIITCCIALSIIS